MKYKLSAEEKEHICYEAQLVYDYEDEYNDEI